MNFANFKANSKMSLVKQIINNLIYYNEWLCESLKIFNLNWVFSLAYLLGSYDRTLHQRIADVVDKWCSNNQMRLNTNKCKIISVLPMNSQAAQIVTLHGKILEVNYCKYLGIHLTNNLNWDSQWERVQKITQSFSYILNQLKKAGFRVNTY